MKAIYALAIVLVWLSFSCDVDEGVDPGYVYTVTYSLYISGESSVDQVTYYFNGSNTTAHNPSSGWSAKFTVGGGHTVSASATGTAKNGVIWLYMRVSPEPGDDVVRIGKCGALVQAPCSLSTGGVKLY